MIYGSVCSGVEAASLAWAPLGWIPAWFSEIEPFPCAVLKARFPHVPNLGDMTHINTEKTKDGQKFIGDAGISATIPGGIDLLVGGTPCQGFSIAGQRKGMADNRSGLARRYIELLAEARPSWFIWENVPGALSTAGGADFRDFIASIVEIGYSVAWRILDAQYVRTAGFPRAVPQRRRRLFVVGHIGDWRGPAEVLFKSEGVLGNASAGREMESQTARDASPGAGGAGGFDSGTVICIANTQGRAEILKDCAPALTCLHEQPLICPDSRTKIICYENHAQDARLKETNISPSITARAGTGGNNLPLALIWRPEMRSMRIRRLTPLECERLMGFPDCWTRIPYKGKPEEKCPDSLRYKACGNSMCVNVMRWLGIRIDQTERRKQDGSSNCRSE